MGLPFIPAFEFISTCLCFFFCFFLSFYFLAFCSWTNLHFQRSCCCCCCCFMFNSVFVFGFFVFVFVLYNPGIRITNSVKYTTSAAAAADAAKKCLYRKPNRQTDRETNSFLNDNNIWDRRLPACLPSSLSLSLFETLLTCTLSSQSSVYHYL